MNDSMPETDRPVRLGLIGCGNFSRAHIKRLQEIPNAAIAALADVNPDNLAQRVADFPILADVPAYHDHHELLKTDIDGVVIVTPHGLHYQLERTACRDQRVQLIFGLRGQTREWRLARV